MMQYNKCVRGQTCHARGTAERWSWEDLTPFWCPAMPDDTTRVKTHVEVVACFWLVSEQSPCEESSPPDGAARTARVESGPLGRGPLRDDQLLPAAPITNGSAPAEYFGRPPGLANTLRATGAPATQQMHRGTRPRPSSPREQQPSYGRISPSHSGCARPAAIAAAA